MPDKNIAKRRRVMERSIKLGHCICDPKLACPCELLREKDVCLCAGERIELTAGPVRLTRLVEKTGCASKIDQATLRRVLGGITMPQDPRVIVGAPAGDDAGVFRADDGKAWVQTVDVFSPCVDDPYQFGQIAAANSVSDIYAMGGAPMTALSIVGFPARELPDAIMSEIIRGGVDKMAEAGVAIIGGHSINDREIKAGFAVTGLIDPDRIMTNAAARPGDALVLTKPIGTGILSFAAQIDRLPTAVGPRTVEPDDRAGSTANPPTSVDALDTIGRSMAALNKTAAEWMLRFDAHACTDITGFGMMGHLSSMASASGVDLEITWDDVPLFDGVLECVAAGIVPGAIERNRESSQHAVIPGDGVTPGMLDILFDAQTSGGLLIALPHERAGEFIHTLHREGVAAAAIVGRVIDPVVGRVPDSFIDHAIGSGGGTVHVRTTHRRSSPESLTPDLRPLTASPPRGTSAMSDQRSHESRSHESRSPGCCSPTADSTSDAAGDSSGTDSADCCSFEARSFDCCSHAAESGLADDRPIPGSRPSGVAATPSGSPAGEAQRKFGEFLRAVNQPGALDAHTKQAISIALSLLIKCEPCLVSHIAKAREQGFSTEEIDEAAWMAISFGGAPLMMFYKQVVAGRDGR